MKQKLLAPFLVLALLALAVVPSFAADEVKYGAMPGGGQMRISGTSTIHKWHADTKLIGGSFRCDKGISLDDLSKLKPGKLAGSVGAIIPTGSFACSSGSSMDKVMRTAMNADSKPLIKFESTSLEIKSINKDGTLTLAVKGDLAVMGVKKPLAFDVTMASSEAGKKLTFSGTVKVKMTDFGIDPPSPSISFGLIKTGDEVTLTFEWKTIRRD